MIVMKFGGSSLRDPLRIQEVCSIIASHVKEQPMIVVSAMGNTTDALLVAAELAAQGHIDFQSIRERHVEALLGLNVDVPEIDLLLKELEETLTEIALEKVLTLFHRNRVVAFGERMSARIVSAALCEQGIPAVFADAWDLGFVRPSDAIEEGVPSSQYIRIREAVEERTQKHSKILVLTGFLVHDELGRVSTLGRGGSDFTATILGAALGVREVQVWKDVDGILTADPRVVPSATPIADLSYAEAAELAYFGAKVLHPVCLSPVVRSGIPVRVKNSYAVHSPGTLISSRADSYQHELNGGATAVTSKRQVVLVDIQSSEMQGQFGFLAKVFQTFAEMKISVDMIATSEVSVSVTVAPGERLAELQARLGQFASVRIREDVAAISVIGDARFAAGLLAAAGQCFSDLGVPLEMVTVGASKLNIGMLVPQSTVDECVRALHEKLFSTSTRDSSVNGRKRSCG
jgi:aspartate kinase